MYTHVDIQFGDLKGKKQDFRSFPIYSLKLIFPMIEAITYVTT